MGATKTELFQQHQVRFANLAKAMGHPARIAIVEYLLERQSCVCGDIVEELPLSQATVSQHLKALKEADLIQGNIEGRTICYCLKPEAFVELKQFVDALAKRFNCC